MLYNFPAMTCLIVDDEEMSRQILSHFVNQTEGLELTKVCQDGIEAANFLQNNAVDALFLDVEMPGMSGMELLGTLSVPPLTVLVTSRPEYAAAAFEHSVTDYLVKPVAYARFLKAVTRLRENLNGETAPASPTDLYVKTDSRFVKISMNDLLYVEALADYVLLHTVSGKHIVHSTMKGIEKRLGEKQFVRIHRSYIVNIEKIEAIEDVSVVINKKYIAIGASYKEEFMKKLNIL
jgi:DNA-binding LytR/AlgR family response regulator